MTLEQRLAREVAADLDGWVDAVLGRVGSEVPALVADDAAADLATSSTRALLTEFATTLGLGDVPATYRAPAAALGFGRHLARHGVALAGLLRSYRLGQELLFLRAAQLVDPGDTDGLSRVGLLTFRFVDAVVGEVTDAFESERETWLRGSLARRDRVIARLLAGEDLPVGEAERVLGRRLSGRHLAVIAWSDEADAEALAARIRPALEAADTGAPLVVPGTAGEVFAWIAPGTTPVPPDGVRFALGAVGVGPAGFADSRRQADAARRTARFVDGPVVAYEDVRLLHLLLRDHAAAIAFAREELGALADAPAELRRTLWAFLAAGRDATATAARLGLHRNTVMRRLSRAQELLGGPADRTAELMAALLVLGAGGPGHPDGSLGSTQPIPREGP